MADAAPANGVPPNGGPVGVGLVGHDPESGSTLRPLPCGSTLAVTGEFPSVHFIPLDPVMLEESRLEGRRQITSNWGCQVLQLSPVTLAQLETSGSTSGVNFVDLTNGKCTRGAFGHSDALDTGVEFPSSFRDTGVVSDFLFTGSADKTIRGWSLRGLLGVSEHFAESCRLVGHTEAVYGLCVCGFQQKYLFSSSFDWSARLWDVEHSKCIRALEKERFHGGVCFSCASSEIHGSVFTGCFDGVVRMFDIRALVEFEKPVQVEKAFTIPVGVSSIGLEPERNLLFAGDSQGCVWMWDLRNSSVPLLSKTLHEPTNVTDAQGQTRQDASIWQIDPLRPFQSCRCRRYISCGKDGKVLLSDENLKVHSTFEMGALSAALYLGPFGDASLDLGSPPPRVSSVLFDQGLLNFEIRSSEDSSVVVRCSKWLFSESRTLPVGTYSEWSVGIDLSPIDERVFLEVLLGMSPIPPEKLYDYFLLFCELGLLRHAFLACQATREVKKIGIVVLLARKAFSRECPDPEVEVSDETLLSLSSATPLPPRGRLSAFAEAILGVLRVREKSIRRDPVLVGALGHHILALVLSPESPLAFIQHPDFVGFKDEPPVSFLALSSARSADLFLTRAHSNVVLTTEDGSEENAHIEILVARSGFFRKMVEFCGSELGELKSSRRISIENMSGEDLRLLLCWVYTASLPEDLQFHTLLDLLVHAEMYLDVSFQRLLRMRIANLVHRTTPAETVLSVLGAGQLISDLPESSVAWLSTVLQKSLQIRDKVFEAILSYGKKLHSQIGELERILAEHHLEIPGESEEKTVEETVEEESDI